MDARLRNALRDYQRGEISQEAALVALARAGVTRASRIDFVEVTLRRVFLEELDYGTVERVLPAFVTYSHFSSSLMATACGFMRRTFDVPAGGPTLIVGGTATVGGAVEPHSPGAPGVGRGGTALPIYVNPAHRPVKWDPIQAEDLDLAAERDLAHGTPDVWAARQRHSKEAVIVRVWHPSRLDALEAGTVDDLRIDVSAPLRERSLVLECLTAAFAGASVVSSQVSGGKRPPRFPAPAPKRDEDDEAAWPGGESSRVHVR